MQSQLKERIARDSNGVVPRLASEQGFPEKFSISAVIIYDFEPPNCQFSLGIKSREQTTVSAWDPVPMY